MPVYVYPSGGDFRPHSLQLSLPWNIVKKIPVALVDLDLREVLWVL